MEIPKDPAIQLKNLARALAKEHFAKDSPSESWLEFFGKIAVILVSLGVLSFLALGAILYILGGGRRHSYRYSLLSSLTAGQFLMIWAAVMAICLIAGYVVYRRHKESGVMVDQWSETKGQNPFEPFAVMIFQTLDSLFARKSQKDEEKAALFAAGVLKFSTEEGGLNLVSSSQVSDGARKILRDSLGELPSPLEQETILKSMFKSEILRRKASQTTTTESTVPGDVGIKLLKRFGILNADATKKPAHRFS